MDEWVPQRTIHSNGNSNWIGILLQTEQTRDTAVHFN